MLRHAKTLAGRMPRWSPAPGRWSRDNAFAARLLLALALTLAALGAAQYWIVSRELAASATRTGVAAAEADARAIEMAYVAAEREQPLAEAAEVVSYIARRSGIIGVYLIGPDGAVVAAHDPGEIGELEADKLELVRDGTTTARGEREEEAQRDDVEYVTPVALAGSIYALEIDADGDALTRRLDELQRETMLLGAIGLLLAVPVFYLVGGRRLKQLHRSAVSRATRDGLTDLGNRTAFHEELRRGVALAVRHEEPLCVAMLDLDDFKLANDRNGHQAGDTLLVGVARLLASGRPEDRAFRLGGDEFALLLPRTGMDGAVRRLDAIRAAAAGTLGAATLSCGVAEIGPAMTDVESVVEQADAALYEAKRRGRDRTVRFDELDGTMVVTAARVRALDELLDGAPVEIAFQPIWELGETRNRLVGFEALARPQVRDLMDPALAFEVAERIGRAHLLDALCRRAVLARAHELPPGALLFLNVSPQSLDQDELAGDALVRAVRAAGLEPAAVVLEITERSAARLDRVVREAGRLRTLGFKIALDDVGAGNAGLEMLRSLPVDFVKIDRAVIVASGKGGSARAVLHAVVSFAAEVGAFVIAEGIEDEAMLAHVRQPGRRPDVMRRAGVHGVQGYLLGRPSVSLPSLAEAA